MQSRYESLQALRAFAALAVVLEHTLYRGRFIAPELIPYSGVVPYGSIGVGIFFALSGWLMGTILMRGFDPWFLVRRALRIYPPFWAAAGLSLVVFSWIGLETFSDWRALFLIPARSYHETFNIPYWTLVYEMAFYVVVFAFMLVRIRKPVVEFLLIAWAAVIILNFFYFGEPSAAAPGWKILLGTMNLYFILGMLAAVSEIAIPKGVPVSVVLFGAMLIWTIGQSLGAQRLVIVGLQCCAATLVVLAMLRVENMPKFMIHLGDASYGIYLVHFITIEAFARVYARLHLSLPGYVVGLAMFLAAVMVGWIFGSAESLIHKALSRLLPKANKLTAIRNDPPERASDLPLREFQ